MAMTERHPDSGEFMQKCFMPKNVHMLGEIDEDQWLLYNGAEHSFGVWNTAINDLKSVKLVGRHTTGSGVSEDVLAGVSGIRQIALHPGAYKSAFPYLVIVDSTDKV
jgi:hypothetical protein